MTEIDQIRLPLPEDTDPHPRLIVFGCGTHAGDCFTALFPDGWHDISLEVSWDTTGPESWYIATDGFTQYSPIGLFVKRRY